MNKDKSIILLGFVVTVIVVILIISIFSLYLKSNTSIEFDCSVEGIRYANLKGNTTCWSNSFSDDYCPLPTNIRCSGDVPIFMIKGVID